MNTNSDAPAPDTFPLEQGRAGNSLWVRDLTVFAPPARHSRPLARDVSFDLGPGQTLGIVGESGSGKSLTARALISLLPDGLRCEGTVTFGGESIIGRSERDLRSLRGNRLALLMQDPFTMLNPLQTAAQHVAESLSKRKRTRAERAEEVRRRLAEVGIEDADAARRYPFQLSGGMQQRVALACALARDPELLIADEPTTALDATTQVDVLALLRQVQEARGMSLVFITHDLRVAFAVCDRVAVMYAGRIVEQASAATVRSEPHHPYTLALLQAEPPVTHVRRQLATIPGNVPAPDRDLPGCVFAPRCSWAVPSCRTDTPAVIEVAPDHQTACLRVAAIADEMQEELARQDAVPDLVQPRTVVSHLLRVQELRKTYRTVGMVSRARHHEALSGVSFDVGVDESVALVGESGSGKTTVFRCLLGLVRPTAGSIQLDDLDITDFGRLKRPDVLRVRRMVQCIFQDPYASLNPAQTIGATLREAVGMRAEPANLRAESLRLLGLVGLPAGYESRRPVALSGGERQRVAIARAIAVSPQLLVCDEPVAGLDVCVQAQVLELLRDLRRSLKISMLFVSHDLAVVRQVSDRVIILRRGEIVEEGPTGAVLDDPQHPYTRRLVDSARFE